MGSCLSSDGRSSPSSPSSPASAGGKRHHHNRRGGRKKSGSRKEEEQLHRVPGRMFLNGASEVASLFTQQGKKGTNQDAMIVWENFGSRSDTIFCGIFDGHGPYGHMVAKRVRDILPLKLNSCWEVNIGSEESRDDTISNSRSMNSDDTSSMSLEEEPMVSADFAEKEKHSETTRQLKHSFLKAFKIMDKELRVHPNIDCFCSGTTAVTLIKQGQELIIGNVGDSRAVLGTRDQNESLVAVQLTVDLKPNLPREAERIRQFRGRVFALRDEPDVARVWLPNSDSPGLAMARAFGDFCLKDFGLISVPEITYWRITERDEFIVLATDGVWDVLSNGEVINIVANAPRSTAARLLVESAVRAWRLKYPTSKVDDCAVVCLFFDSDGSLNSSDIKIKEGNEVLDDTGVNSDKQEPVPISLDRLGTVKGASETLQDEVTQSSKNHFSRSPSHQQSSDFDEVQMQNEDWSALEGVSRVNTLLTLPRYVAGGKQSTNMKTQKRA